MMRAIAIIIVNCSGCETGLQMLAALM